MLCGYFCLLLFTTGVETNLLGENLVESFSLALILWSPNNKGKGRANPEDFDDENNDQNHKNAGGNTDNLDDEEDMSEDEAAVEAALMESKKDSEKNVIGNSSNTKVEDLNPNTNIAHDEYLLLAPRSKVRTELERSRIFDQFYADQLELIDATEPDIVPQTEKKETKEEIDTTNQTTPEFNRISSWINTFFKIIYGSGNKSITTKKNGSVDKDNQNKEDGNSDDGDSGGGE